MFDKVAYDKEYNHRRYLANPLEVYTRVAARWVRAQAVLGGRCEVCGIDDPEVLEFNHRIDCDGTEHRKEIGASTAALVNWILREPEQAKGRLELLCANCHAKRHSRFNKLEGYYVPLKV